MIELKNTGDLPWPKGFYLAVEGKSVGSIFNPPK